MWIKCNLVKVSTESVTTGRKNGMMSEKPTSFKSRGKKDKKTTEDSETVNPTAG